VQLAGYDSTIPTSRCARRYRYRLLNGSVSRLFTIALVQQVQGDGGEIPGPPDSGISFN
jgi:hypothetical protein